MNRKEIRRLLGLLERAQEFVGEETSMEIQEPRAVFGSIAYPIIYEAARLRTAADKAERKDKQVVELRAALWDGEISLL